jgi:thiol-disulfide isomerase/thioredoxin
LKKTIAFAILCALAVLGCNKEQPKSPDEASTTEAQAKEASPSASIQEANNSVPMMQPHVGIRPSEGVPMTRMVAGTPAPGAAGPTERVEGWPSKVGDMAWPLKGITMVKGEPVDVTPGHIYVIEFWATWCGPCKTSIPHLTEIQHKYKNKVTVIGITKEPVDLARPFVETQGDAMDYRVAADFDGSVYYGYMAAFNRGGIPCAFIVNAQGEIAWVGHPMAMDGVLEQVVAGTYSLEETAEASTE